MHDDDPGGGDRTGESILVPCFKYRHKFATLRPQILKSYFLNLILPLCPKGHSMKPIELRLAHFFSKEAIPVRISHELSLI